MKKIVCLLLVGMCLFGCKPSTSKLHYTKTENKVLINIEIEYIDNHIEKITEKHNYKNVDDEFRKKVAYDKTEVMFWKDENDGSKGKRSGIKWNLDFINNDSNNLEKEIVIYVDDLSEEDKKLTAEILRYYDYDDVEKTKNTLEEAGFAFEE